MFFFSHSPSETILEPAIPLSRAELLDPTQSRVSSAYQRAAMWTEEGRSRFRSAVKSIQYYTQTIYRLALSTGLKSLFKYGPGTHHGEFLVYMHSSNILFFTVIRFPVPNWVKFSAPRTSMHWSPCCISIIIIDYCKYYNVFWWFYRSLYYNCSHKFVKYHFKRN